jgi:heterotetrameric sarcosine oxidase delta subunit
VRIPCPFCGERDLSEFSYLGDAGYRRPELGSENIGQFHETVYLRDNPAGPHEELWYHAFGCRSWLIVTRDTRNHQIFAARLAKQAALG